MICCASSTTNMNITVVHGFSKFPLTIENIGDSTVDDLSTELEEKSGVPKDNQKLIFKVRVRLIRGE